MLIHKMSVFHLVVLVREYLDYPLFVKDNQNYFFSLCPTEIVALNEELAMPSKTPRHNNGSIPAFEPVEFVDFKLSVSEKEGFLTWRNDKKLDLDVLLINWVGGAKCKMGLSFDQSNSCFICSFTCKDEHNGNWNKCITSRSDDWFEAVALNLYKVEVLLKDLPWNSRAKEMDWG